MNASELKEKHREIRGGFSKNLDLRIHRSISWIARAEHAFANNDHDTAFICYWISFNAIYHSDGFGGIKTGERSVINSYFRSIIDLDRENRVFSAIWDRFSDSIRVLLRNKFVFQPFWRSVNKDRGFENWEGKFQASNRRIMKAFTKTDSVTILSELFDRLYVLRNQLIHGGATWGSSLNRSQVRDGTAILGFLVPIFVDLMMEHPDLNWGTPYYPALNSAP